MYSLNQDELAVLKDAWESSQPQWVGPIWDEFCVRHETRIAAIRSLQEKQLIQNSAHKEEMRLHFTESGFVHLPRDIQLLALNGCDGLIKTLRSLYKEKPGKQFAV